MFSETQGRYIIVKEGQTLNIDEAIEIGQLTDVDEFKVTNAQSSIVEKSQRKESWEGAIKGDQMDQLKDGHNAIGHVRYAIR